MEREHERGRDAVVAEVRADVRHLASDVTELRQDKLATALVTAFAA